MSEFFRNYKTFFYNMDKVKPVRGTLATNLLSRVNVNNEILKNISSYYPYRIKEFERPDRGALADMESKFGPLNTQPSDRGPYGVTDYMDGTKQGRGFMAPGQAPLGFTVDMESLTGGVTSQLDIDVSISLTP